MCAWNQTLNPEFLRKALSEADWTDGCYSWIWKHKHSFPALLLINGCLVPPLTQASLCFL